MSVRRKPVEAVTSESPNASATHLSFKFDAASLQRPQAPTGPRVIQVRWQEELADQKRLNSYNAAMVRQLVLTPTPHTPPPIPDPRSRNEPP